MQHKATRVPHPYLAATSHTVRVPLTHTHQQQRQAQHLYSRRSVGTRVPPTPVKRWVSLTAVAIAQAVAATPEEWVVACLAPPSKVGLVRTHRTVGVTFTVPPQSKPLPLRVPRSMLRRAHLHTLLVVVVAVVGVGCRLL